MAGLWKSVDELYVGRKGTPFSATGPREYTRKFRVITTEKMLGSLAVCTAPGLPLPYSPYQSGGGLEYDLLALMVNITAEQDEADWFAWNVAAEYSTQMPEGGPLTEAETGGNGGAGAPGSSQNNPEMEPPEIEWDWEVTQKAPPRDLNKKAFLNSAKQPFTPAPTFELGYAVLSITRNELSFSRELANSYAFAVNTDLFMGAEPGMAQCLPPKARQMFRGRTSYWRVSYRIRFAAVGNIAGGDVGWQPKILDAGFCELQKVVGRPSLNEPVPIIRNGIAVTQPVLLDGTGSVKKPNAQGVIDPEYVDFEVYPKQPFARLLSRGLG